MGRLKELLKRKRGRKSKGSLPPEDREIQEMEKLLGMKKTKSKLSTEFTMDGLDYVLNYLSDTDNDDIIGNNHHSDTDNDDIIGNDHKIITRKRTKHTANEECSNNEEETKKGTKHVKFNFSHEPKIDSRKTSEIIIETNATERSCSVLRKHSNSIKPDLDRLRRTIRGLLNRLSESNLCSIVSQLEQMYSVNSRNDVNSVLTEVLLKATIQPILLSNKMAMEHTMIIGLLHSNIGTEVGAYFVEQLVKTFNSLYNGERIGKECDCTVLLLAQLYTFKVIHCVLIYDIIRKLLQSFTETDIELLVLILKECGMEIRKDDPGSLKEIIKQIQSKAAIQSAANAQSSRVKFMLEVIAAIKTNNSHKIPNYDPELKLHMRKLLRGLGRTPGTVMNESNQLKISLIDLLEAESRGRWWIVGSSWSGRTKETTPTSNDVDDDKIESNEILELAKEQRMSTDIRKNIFCLIMTSEDYIDAFTKLIRLKLKSTQDREIVHVLLDCCIQEKVFNPFYVYLGQKLCGYHRNHQVTFQYGIWDRLKSLDSLNRVQLGNLCQFLINMIHNKSLSVSILKIVEFSELNHTGVTFYCSLFRNLLLKLNIDQTRVIFSRAYQSKVLLSNLCVFIKQYLNEGKFNDQCEVIEQCLKLSV